MEKVLHKLNLQITELINNLPNFTHVSVQPSVDECNQLQQQLFELQESLIIYKYHKTNKEISPSFNIHAKLNELNQPENQNSLQIEKPKKNDLPQEPKVEITEEMKVMVAESIQSETKITHKPFSIAMNDKFRFINDLFIHNSSEYAIAIEQINNLQNWHDCEIYLNSLKNLYEWKEHNETVKHLYTLVKKRFE